MSLAKRTARFGMLTVIAVILLFSTGSFSPVSAHKFTVEIDGVIPGSGSAGSGSLAVAAVYSESSSSGTGGFSGSLLQPVLGGLDTIALFSLTTSNPSNAPILSCPNGQVSLAGPIISGNFHGGQVMIAACVGSGQVLDFTVQYRETDVFNGHGTGSTGIATSSLRAVFASVGVTSGSGTAGTGRVFTAEADAVARDGSLVGGGAYSGTVSSDVTGVWLTQLASVSACTLTSSGVTADFGSFPGQPVTSSYSLLACPPAGFVTGVPVTTRVLWGLGGNLNIIYKGAGTDSSILELIGA